MDILNEQSIKLISNKLFGIINYTLPGIFILELFFKKGLFSNVPITLFEFLLFLFWSFILSIPYNLINPVSMSNFLEEKKTIVMKDESIDKEKFLSEFERLKEENKEENEKTDSMLHFIFIIIYLLILYLTNKLLISFFTYDSFLNINKPVLIYIYSNIALCIISFLIIFPCSKFLEKRYITSLLKSES